MLEKDLDDNVQFVKKKKNNNQKNYKKTNQICIKNQHFLQGMVIMQVRLRMYLNYLESIAYTDGNEFIEFMVGREEE